MSRSYRLGGVSPTPWMTRRRIIQIAVVGAVAVAMAVIILGTQNPWVALGFIALGVLGFAGLRYRTELGELWVLDVGEQVRNLLGRWGKWDEFDPAVDQAPWLLPPMVAHGVVGPKGSELGVLHYGDSMVALLEVSGDGEGVRTESSVARLEDAVVAVHEELARPQTGVVQLDWITMIRPESAKRVSQLSLPRLAEHVAPELKESWRQLPACAAAETETVRTWLAVRFDVNTLYGRFARPPYNEQSGLLAAQEALGAVVRVLQGHGHTAIRALSLTEIAALSRATLDPARDPDDLEGLGAADDVWAGVPGWTWPPKKDYLECGEWLHSTAGFSRLDWPLLPVFGRWLHPLLTRRSLGPRTIIAQLRLVPRVNARRLARSQQTSAASRRLQNRGRVDGGEAQAEESTAAVITADLTVRGGVGVVPRVRILLSGRTERELRDRREALLATAVGGDMAAESITFDRSRPGAGLLAVLPIGVEVQSE